MGKQSEQVMKKYMLPVLFILFLIFPADSSAGSKTRAQVLSYLTSLPSQPNKKILSGQRTGFLNDSYQGYYGIDMYGNNIFGDIATNSGGYVPAIMGADITYHGYRSSGPYNLQRLIDHWNAGGLVELDWFAADPGNNNVWTWPLNSPVIDIADVYTSGNTIYNNFLDELDQVATAIQTLQNNGVVVLFRPFHEMNNHNANPADHMFWWDGKEAAKFITMWRYVHDYFTNTKGLTNILWVYGPTLYYDVLEYYPGSAYVDIVGMSTYPLSSGSSVLSWSSYYDTLRTLGKPYALTETGLCMGDTTWDACGGKDSRNLINGIKTYYPDAVYFMVWDDDWELGRMTNLSSLFTDPWVVNRTDKPSGGITVQSKKPSFPVGISIR